MNESTYSEGKLSLISVKILLLGDNVKMNINRYLNRIKFHNRLGNDIQTLFKLHQLHVFHVPFENIDIHYKRTISLDSSNIYRKVINGRRGGFCYELNYIFCELLSALGYNSKIISARLFDEFGNLGPEFDHLAMHVKTEREFIADVGFGDLFVSPIEIKPGVQSDGRNYFKIEKHDTENYLLLMSADGYSFQKKYIFNLNKVFIDDFKKICLVKQTDPNSYFVKHLVCTKLTNVGRVTIFDNKLIQATRQGKNETIIDDDIALRIQLRKHFDISIKP